MGINFYSDIEGNGNDLSNWTGGGSGGSGGGFSSLLQNLGAWYTLDEASGTRADSHTNGFDLTDNNTVTSQAGLIGSEAVFVRANSESLSYDTTGVIFQTDPSFTWCGWVTLDNFSNTQYIAAVYNSTGNQRKWYVRFTTSGNVIDYGTSSNGATPLDILSSGFTPTVGVRFHLAISYDVTSNTKTIYINGQPSGTSNPSGGVFTGSTSPFRLGDLDGGSSGTDGKLDEVGYWSRALSDHEVNILHSGGEGITYDDFATGSGSGGSGGSGGTNEGAALSRTTDFSIPVSTSTAVEWEVEDKDDNGYVDLGANNTRITIPEDGTYIVHAQLQLTTTSSANQIRTARIQINGSTLLGRQDYAAIANGAASTTVQVSCIGAFSANDYLEAVTFLNEPGKFVLAAGSYFTIEKIPEGGGGGGSSSTRVIDTFTDTNGTAITAHSPDSGGITWLEHNIVSSGSFTPPIADIQSNALQWIEDNTIAYFDGGSPDGQINVKLTPQVAAGGDAPIIILKKGTEGNQVEIFLREDSDTILIQERISDVGNVLASISYAFAESVEYAISVNFSGLGGSLTVTPQENPLTNPTEPITLSFNINPVLVDNQNVGLASGNIPVATRFDSFSFKAL